MFEEAISQELDQTDIDENLKEFYGVFEITGRGVVKINIVPLARLIMEEHGFHFRTIVDEKSGSKDVFYYKNGYYHPGGEFIIRKLCNKYLEEKTTNTRKNEIIGFIQDSDFAFRDELEPLPHILNLKNGVLDIYTGEMKPHSWEYGFINQLPVNYDKEAKCEKFLLFMSQIFPGKYSKYIDVVQEMFGYCLLRKYPIHVAFILFGGGRNGKSTLVNILQNLLGRDNYATRQLHELISDKFAKADLFGKMANICTEISAKEISDSSNFKALSGGDWITGRYIYRGPFVFRNYAKLIFNANRIPPTSDKSYAFYQRWKIVVFSQTFPRGDPLTIPELDEILSTPEELSGILNWAIEGLKRVLDKKDFTKASHEEDESELYEKLANPEIAFINEYITVDTDSKLSKEEVYERYHMWCENNVYPISTKNMFTKMLQEVIPEAICTNETTTVYYEGMPKTVPAYGRIKWIDKYTSPKRSGEQQLMEDFAKDIEKEEEIDES